MKHLLPFLLAVPIITAPPPTITPPPEPPKFTVRAHYKHEHKPRQFTWWDLLEYEDD